MIDTHCHLTWPEYDNDRLETIVRARNAGLGAMITIGAGQGIAGNAKAIALAEQHPDIYAAVGIHPHDAAQCADRTAAQLDHCARHPKVVAIGEIGLDYHYDVATPAQQQEAFAAQLALALHLHRPVIIHHREAERDLLDILRATVAHTAGRPPAERLRGVVHCFGGSPAFAHELLAFGLYLGVGGVITFKNAAALRDVIARVPLDRIVLETDAPYLAPVPYRGKRNEPAYLQQIVAVLAPLLGVSEATLIARTSANSCALFRSLTGAHVAPSTGKAGGAS